VGPNLGVELTPVPSKQTKPIPTLTGSSATHQSIMNTWTQPTIQEITVSMECTSYAETLAAE
jgi:hypothetical protein